MAITWVHENLMSGSGGGTLENGNTYLRIFDVLADTYDDNALTVSAANDGSTAIPDPLAYFEKGNDTDLGSVVTGIKPERDQQFPLLWHVKVTYTVVRSTDGGSFPGGSFDITYKLPGFRIWGIPVVEILTKDINGEPIENSANVPFSPRPEDVRYITAIEVVSWIRNYDIDWWSDYADTVNASTVWGLPKETILMVGPPHGTRQLDHIGTYWEIRREFHYDPRGWKREFEDRGKVRLAQDDGDPPSASEPATGTVPIADNAGVRINEDVPLDGKGQPLAVQDPPLEREFVEYVVKEPKDWTPQELPAMNFTW